METVNKISGALLDGSLTEESAGKIALAIIKVQETCVMAAWEAYDAANDLLMHTIRKMQRHDAVPNDLVQEARERMGICRLALDDALNAEMELARLRDLYPKGGRDGAAAD